MPVTTAAMESAFERRTTELWLSLVEITHDDFATIRLVNNTEDFTHDGDTYTAWPIEVIGPKFPAGREAKFQISIDVSDGDTYREAFREITTQPELKITIVMASEPDTEQVLDSFAVESFQITNNTLTLSCGQKKRVGMQWPGVRILPTTIGGAFR